jgi:hypothetical protein
MDEFVHARTDDAPQAFTRLAVAKCLDLQLDSIQTAIETGRDRRVIAALVSNYTQPARTWDSEAWKAAVASDAASHASADQMVTWSLPYRLVPLLQSINLDEFTEAAQVQPTRSGGGQLATAEADRMLVADHTLRELRNRSVAEELRSNRPVERAAAELR